MNNLKKIISVVFAGLVMMSLYSCQDFLSNTDKSKLTDKNQWSSEGNADIFLNDIYGNLPNYWNSPENLDNYTDDNDAGYYYISYKWKDGIVKASSNNYSTFGGGATGPAALSPWPDTYTRIRKCNTFIKNVKEHEDNFSEDWLNKRLDEAKYLRAYFYSQLFLKIGGMPIITGVLNRREMDSTQIYNKRKTYKETVDFLTGQLDTVVTNGYLPVKYEQGESNAGRATLGAALMLKGWLELNAASPAYNAGTPAAGSNPDKVVGYGNYKKKRWKKAAGTFKQFIDEYGNGHPYSLYPDLSSLWYESNEYNSEVIWDRQVVGNTDQGSSFEQYGGPVWINGAYYTWGNYDPTQELVDQFFMENGKSIDDPNSGYDPQNPYKGRSKRFYDWIVYDGASYKMDWMSKTDTIYTRIDKVNPKDNEIDFGTDDIGNTGYYFKKKLNPLVRPGGGPVSGANYIYYRYAEVLLGYAEAQNEWSGPDQSVYNAINKIRNRADLPDLQPGLSQSEMREAIHHERRVELCFEQKRYYDIIRWKKAMDLMNEPKHGIKITNTSPSDNSGVWQYEPVPLNHPHTFTKKMYLVPVPQDVIDRNPNLIQNPGY